MTENKKNHRAAKLVALLLAIIISAPSVFASGGKDDSSMAEASPEAGEITVFLAASTTDVMNDLADLYRERTETVVKTNPASSGTLARQLEQGAEADVYVSASKKWMDYADDLEIVLERSPFVRNRVVLIAPEDSSLAPFELGPETDFPALFSGRLSMGDPAHVPAGRYAQEALEHYGWFGILSGRIQPAADVRAALSVVELGETELGIVYETDAMKSGKVKILSEFPEESHAPVEYSCAMLTPGGEGFYEFLLGSDAAAVYAKYGFTPVVDE